MNNNDIEHIYYDLEAFNNNELKGDSNLSFQEARTTSFLTNPSDYYMSVVRFELSSTTLPVMIPSINPYFELSDFNSNFVNTTYKIGIVQNYNSPSTTTSIYTVPYVPSSYNFNDGKFEYYAGQTLDNPFFYINSYQQFCNMINYTLIIMAQQTGCGVPTLKYNASTQLFSMILPMPDFDYAFALGTVSYPKYSLYFNEDLQNVLSGFNYVKEINNNIIAQPFPDMYQLSYSVDIFSLNYTPIYNNTITPNPPVITQLSYIEIFQDTTSIPFMNPIQSIVFTSLSLPVSQNLTGLAKKYNTPTLSNTVGGNNSNFTNIITDFIVPFQPGSSYRNSLNYAPSGEYRLIDLIGSGPLYNMDVQVYWKDRFNNLHPIVLPYKGYSSIKILFRKKIFNGT